MRPPPRPYQTPLYKKGLRVKPVQYIQPDGIAHHQDHGQSQQPGGEPDDAPQYIQHRRQAIHPFGVDLNCLHVG
jgi:hypothetical protein